MWIVKANGVYDILCFFAITKTANIPILKNLHLDMYREPPTNPNWLAIYVGANGLIRLRNNNIMIAYSYLLEAMVFLFEMMIGRVYPHKAVIVAATSLALAYYVLEKKHKQIIHE